MMPRRRAGTGWPPIRGSPTPSYNLGLMYDNGEGVVEDDAEAVRWYREKIWPPIRGTPEPSSTSV